MKTDIHPSYIETKVHCSCGETFTTYSTKKEIAVEICSKCHPFYTGKQKFVDSGGRVERFQKKFEAARAKIEAKQQSAVRSQKSEETAQTNQAEAPQEETTQEESTTPESS